MWEVTTIKFRSDLCPSDSNGPIDLLKIKEWAERFSDFPTLAIEPKYDGSRYLLHLHQKGHHLTSRRISKKTGLYSDRIKNVPHIKKLKIPKSLEGTVIDGEVVSASMKLAGKGGVAGILNSNPKRARHTQKKYGKLKLMAFNLLYYNGVSLNKSKKQTHFAKRRELLIDVLEKLRKYNPNLDECIQLTPQIKPKKYADVIMAYQSALRQGYEGIMVKDLRAFEGQGMWKMKIFRDTCCIITGVTNGQGKYSHLIGAIKFSVYDKGKLREIGQCSGMDDATRKQLTRWYKQNKLIGKIIEVRCQELGPGENARLRHPRFIRLRIDYPEKKCTIQKVRKDLSIANEDYKYHKYPSDLKSKKRRER